MSLDYGELAKSLEKAGLVTSDQLDKVIKQSFADFSKQSSGKQANNSNGEESDAIWHMNGGCGNDNCKIAKEAQKIYGTAYTRGLYHGVKTGQMAAVKGMKL